MLRKEIQKLDNSLLSLEKKSKANRKRLEVLEKQINKSITKYK